MSATLHELHEPCLVTEKGKSVSRDEMPLNWSLMQSVEFVFINVVRYDHELTATVYVNGASIGRVLLTSA